MPTVLLLCSLLQVGAFGPSVASSGQRHAVGNMSLTLSETQTIEALTVPAADLAGGRFDFMPKAASFRGSHHLGDVTMRVRVVGMNSSFTTLTTGGSLADKVAPLPTPPGELAAADLSATLATPPTLSLGLERHYERHPDGQGLKMRFVLRNRGAMTRPSPLLTAHPSHPLRPSHAPDPHGSAHRCDRRRGRCVGRGDGLRYGGHRAWGGAAHPGRPRGQLLDGGPRHQRRGRLGERDSDERHGRRAARGARGRHRRAGLP